MEEYIIWIVVAIFVLEFIGKAIPDERVNGPVGYAINILKHLLVLLKQASDYLNRESEDQKAMKKSRYI